MGSDGGFAMNERRSPPRGRGWDDGSHPLAPNVCAVCGQPLRGRVRGIPRYLCRGCFTRYRQAFTQRAAWLWFLVNAEKQRRKRRNRTFRRVGRVREVSLDVLCARERRDE